MEQGRLCSAVYQALVLTLPVAATLTVLHPVLSRTVQEDGGSALGGAHCERSAAHAAA